MKILMVVSEAVPFAKTGGLADVGGTLPRFLRRLGHDVRIVLPHYRAIDLSLGHFHRLPGPLKVPMGIIGELSAGVLEGRLPTSRADESVPIYLIEYNQYFDRDGIYNDAGGNGFLDNDNRFVFLSRAALELCKKIDFAPDVVHANDWPTAICPVFLETLYRQDPYLSQTASVLTIHNMNYQGRFYSGLMDVLGVGWMHFNMHGLEWNGMTNLLKGGIYYATLLNAVSPRYAYEITTPEFGCGLEDVIRERSGDLRGILNGVDEIEWNPRCDPHIISTYHPLNLRGKAKCKADLQRSLGLPERDVPLFGVISRLVHQKGLDVLAGVLEQMLQWEVQFVLLGSGEPWAQDFFSQIARRYPERFACRIGYDEALAHRIEAGADFFVMPSRFEPCGLNQLYSLAYGTLPIVHAVGGLDDTVINFDQQNNRGTGFKFYDLTERALLDTLGWATSVWYNHRESFEKMQRRAMTEHFSWSNAALAYAQLYADAIAKKRGLPPNSIPAVETPVRVSIQPSAILDEDEESSLPPASIPPQNAAYPNPFAPKA